MFNAFLNGLLESLGPLYLLLIAAGSILGVIISAMPGLTVSLAVALLLPLTFYLDPGPSMALMVSVFVGGMAGGAAPAILINIPGNPASVVTNLDGYPLAKKGRPSEALAVAFVSSILGSFIGLIFLVTLSPIISGFALNFRAPELFALILLGLSLVCSFSQKNLLRGFISVALGLLVVTIGLDPIGGVQRFTFGSPYLQRGINFTPVMIGIFAIPEVLAQFEKKGEIIKSITINFMNNLKESLASLKKIITLMPTVIRSSLIGTGVGALPGTGSAIAAVIAYEWAKRSSKKPDEFGKGVLEGISASEAANSSMCGGALIPMLTLGIPGDPITAVMLGALVIQGLNPGPLLFIKNADLVNTIFGSYFVALIATLLFTLLAIPIFVRVIKFPTSILMPVVLLLSIIGAFSLQRNFIDIWFMFVFGCLGYIMTKLDYPTLPMLLGIILGNSLEGYFRMSLVFSQGSPLIFFQRPISFILILITVVYLFFQLRGHIWQKSKSVSA